MAKKLKDTDLVRIIDDELALSAISNSKISKERATAQKYYFKEPFGDEKSGRSQFRSSEVQEVISWALSYCVDALMKQDIISFDPAGPGEEAAIAAELATVYAQHVFFKKNNGRQKIYDLCHDAFLNKNGTAKVYYDNTQEYTREEYKEISDIELSQLLDDPAVEPIEVDSIAGPVDPMTGQSANFHDISIKRKKSKAFNQKIDIVPPEELIVSKNARSVDLNESPFVAQKTLKTISWLRQQSYKVADDINDGNSDGTEWDETKLTREAQDGLYQSSYGRDAMIVDPSQREVWVVEATFKVDFNGDGIAEWRKVTKVGSKVLDNEEVFMQPFVSTSPSPQPHKFNGRSLADEVLDLQRLKSQVMRAMLDSFAFNINPTKAVNTSQLIDINDLLDNRPGSYKRFRGDVNNAIMALPSQGLGQDAFSLLGYIDNITESRTGVNRMTQGIDANVFNKTATGTQAIMNASQAKLSLILRLLAEALGEIYLKIIQLASRYAKGPELLPLNGEFIEVNPKIWTNLDTISLHIGTGANDDQANLMYLNQLIQLQGTLANIPAPEVKALVNPQNTFNVINKMTKVMGYKGAEQFFTNPKTPEYQQQVQLMTQKMQPPPDPQMEFVGVEKQKIEQDMLIKTADFELSKLKADRDWELSKFETRLKYEVEAAKLNQKDEHKIIDQLSAGVGALEPGQGLLPQSEIAALQDVSHIQQSHNPTPQQPQPPPAPDHNAMMMQMMQKMHDKKPPAMRVLRDENGKMIGVEPVEQQ
jgi:hypothetical protein